MQHLERADGERGKAGNVVERSGCKEGCILDCRSRIALSLDDADCEELEATVDRNTVSCVAVFTLSLLRLAWRSLTLSLLSWSSESSLL